MDKQKRGKSNWELEQSFDRAVTLAELIESPPFKDTSDSSGVSHVAGTRVPTWIHRRVSYLSEMKGTPYHIHSDVLRDAIYIGLRVLSMRYKLSPEWDVEARMARAVDKVGTVKRIRSQIKELSAGLEEMTSNRDIKQAIEGLEDFVIPVLELDDQWYRRKIIELIMDNRVIRDVLSKCSDKVQSAVTKIYKEGEQ